MRLPPRRVLAFACLAAVCSAGCRRAGGVFHVATPDVATHRRLPAGEVVGGEGRYGSYAWLGIPYAAPPVGERRWRAPEAMAPWTGVREALAFGAPCPQFGSPFGGAPGARVGEPAGDEDCLTLNVWTPRFPPGAVPTGAARLPVLVWIHGGGNTIGHAAFYDGGNLAATQGLVVVSVQYRLGPFGWLRQAALRDGAASDAERSGNFGTLDLVRALEWVRDDIAGFGGDPAGVTIAGESAGGTDVFTLLLAPQARGLFQRAIVESGGLRMATPGEAEHLVDDPAPGHPQSSGEILLRLLERDGAPDRARAQATLAAMRPAAVAAYLRGKSTRDILTAYTPTPSGFIDMPDVFADGTVLPADDPLAHLARADGWNRVPVLVGTNRDENKLFMFADPALVRRRFWVFPRFVDEPRYLLSAEYLARLWKATGADEPAAAMRVSEPAVFVYRFDWREEPTVLGADLAKMLGAAHAFEIPFVFGHFDLGRQANVIFTRANEPGRTALSRAMMSYWAAFARSGAPGRGIGGDLPLWAPWDAGPPEHPRVMILDTEAGGGMRMTGGVETRARVLADVAADPRLPTPRARCRTFHDLVTRGRLPKAAYPVAGGSGCADFPFDTYPWGG